MKGSVIGWTFSRGNRPAGHQTRRFPGSETAGQKGLSFPAETRSGSRAAEQTKEVPGIGNRSNLPNPD
jgi:hypothetical protein